MPGTLAPAPWSTFLDDDGTPLAGGLVHTYAAGTLDDADTYSDADLTVPHANPIVLDAAGRATIYLDETSYKFIVRRSDGSLVRTQDNIVSTGAGSAGVTGEAYNFGGAAESPVAASTYAVGVNPVDLHPGTTILNVDSANLPGTYKLEGMLQSDGANTLRLALVNLSDGTPAVPMVEISTTSVNGARVESDEIVWPAAGAARNYGVKSKITGGNGYAWGIKLKRV